jgi:hypothetical protein
MPPLRSISAERATACLHYERCLEALDAQGADR